MNFDNDPKGILKKEKHFQLSVFHADFKYAVKNGFPIGYRKVLGRRGQQDANFSDQN